MENEQIITQILHADRRAGAEHGSLHKPIHTSVAFGYATPQELAQVFQGQKPGYAYARQGNPTTAALEDKITLMENGVKTICFSTGMAAIGALCLSLLQKGDHIIASSFLFGNTNSMFNTLIRLGLEVSFVDATDISNVKQAIKPSTKMVFVETIANPVTQVADLMEIGAFCCTAKLIYVIDNTMTPAYVFSAKKTGATFAVQSLTKSIGGHGDALGGALTDLGEFDWASFSGILDDYKQQDSRLWAATQIRKKGLRDFGAALGPEDAHRLALGAETVTLRLDRTCANALQLAKALSSHPKISKVNYPGLSNHPQHERSKKLFKYFGSLLSFELKEGFNCMEMLSQLKIAVNSSNLGDNRTLVIPVAHTIFWEMGPARRASMGIADSLVRVSVGLEDAEDLISDFITALDAL